MRARRFIALLALAVTGTVAAPAQAAPQATPFLPMALITVSRGPVVGPTAVSPQVFFPSEWSCFNTNPQEPDPFTVDVTCIPPAPPAGTQNWCGWVASFSQSDANNEFAPQTTSYCDNAAATAGRGVVGAVATANARLTALRCRINLQYVPPTVSFRSGCTVNH